MATTAVNKVSTSIEDSPTIKAVSVTRLVKNISGMAITNFKPIVNDGWDDTESCIKIRLPNNKNDIILGVTIDSVDDQKVTMLKYVSNGVMIGVDTSSYNVNDFLYAKTDGSFTNDPGDDPDNTIPQEIGLVIRSHATLGEVYISAVASQVRYIKLTALAVLEAKSAEIGSGLAGNDIVLIGGDGDGIGVGGDVVFEPGESDSGEKGSVLIKQPGTLKSSGNYIKMWHDGVHGFLKTLVGGVLDSLIFIGKIIFRNTSDTNGTKQVEMLHDGIDGVVESKSGLLKIIGTKLRSVLASDHTKFVDVYHDGTDGFIEPSTGDLKTNNKNINVGIGKIISNKFADITDPTKVLTLIFDVATMTTKTITIPNMDVNLTYLGQDLRPTAAPTFANITDNGLTAFQIVETDAAKKLISAAKGTAYNKDFGITAGTVCQGNDSRLSDNRTPLDNSVTTAKMSSTLPDDSIIERDLRFNGSVLEQRTRTFTITNGVISAVGAWGSWNPIGAI